MNRFVSIVFAVVGGMCCVSYQALGNIPYFQGFETNLVDWTYYLAMNRVPSGGGLLGVTSAHGDYYAEIENVDSNYSGSMGDAGHTFFGGPVSAYTGNFYQAIAVYVNTGWGPVGQGFWIDQSPCGTNGSSAYDDESGFYFSVPSAGTVHVGTGGGALLDITASGWYTFVETFRHTGTGVTDMVKNDFLVYNKDRLLIASNMYTSTLPSPGLGGNSYLWITVWNNGFAHDWLAIDDTRAGPLPFEPLPNRKPAALLQVE